MSSAATPRIIALMNQKGGVGKTTTAVNLGAALAGLGRRVCLVDLDPQSHLTLHLGVETAGRPTVYDLLIDPRKRAADCLVRAVRPNLDVLPAERDLAAAETELAGQDDRIGILRRKFGAWAGRYEFVLIDCPPSLGLLTLNALALSSEVFVPMQAHFFSLQGVGRLLETVGMVCQSVNPSLRVTGVVLCMHEVQTTLAREVMADLETFFHDARDSEVPWRDCRVLQPAIRRNVKLAEAPGFGGTIFDYDPGCAGAGDYRRLADGLIGGSAAEPLRAEAAAEPKMPEVVTLAPGAAPAAIFSGAAGASDGDS
jgi:chromosome partitioning protein